MGGAFQVEQPPIDAPSQGPEVGEITQTPSNAKVIRVVEGSLGAQSAPPLEVLLDVTTLVLDVQAGQDAVGDDACREAAWACSQDLAINQELNTIRAAQIEIVANHLLKELPSTHRVIEHLGEADLHLEDRETVGKPEAASSAVRGKGSDPTQRSKKSWMLSALNESQIACSEAGSAQARKPLSRASHGTPRRCAWRLAHSWALRQTFTAYGA